MAQDYESVIKWAPRSRMAAETLRIAVESYGRRLVQPPHYDLADFVAVEGAVAPTWSVVVPLFTAEEGRSDLSLELTMVEKAPGEWEAEVDDLHVL
ncbi:DUF7668 domain-containing protein [Rubrivivax gelatinosus]|uniref:DUF7668 domain-containing protein n=1 Tax=Rubrivivax gelatinosus TaxID=28068 RepID=UPI0010475EE9|nr:hypothetical protein [Rubrivivax gelatinosus]